MASTITICSPVALGAAQARPVTPRLPTLRDRVLGIRLDPTWRSWILVADELAQIARHDWGVRDVVGFEPGVRLGSPDDESRKIGAFAARVEAAVVGLGT